MRKDIVIIWEKMGMRARAALSLSILWLLILAVIGFTHTLKIHMYIGVFIFIVALLIIGVKFYLQRQKLAKAGEYRSGAADFLFSFLERYSPSMPIALMPILDANELRRIAEIFINKGVVIVSFRLLLAAGNNDTDTETASRFSEWLRHYAESYGVEKGLKGQGGFSFYYAENCEFSGQHLIVNILIVESGAAVKYVKNPKQASKPIDIFVDDDFGHESEDDIPEDWQVPETISDDELI